MHLHIDVFILNVGMRTRGVGARAQGSCSPQRFDILPQRRSGLAGCLVSNGASAKTRHHDIVQAVVLHPKVPHSSDNVKARTESSLGAGISSGNQMCIAALRKLDTNHIPYAR